MLLLPVFAQLGSPGNTYSSGTLEIHGIRMLTGDLNLITSTLFFPFCPDSLHSKPCLHLSPKEK